MSGLTTMCQDLHGFEISLTGAMGKEEWQKYRKARIMWAIHYNGEAPTSMKPNIFPLNGGRSASSSRGLFKGAVSGGISSGRMKP